MALCKRIAVDKDNNLILFLNTPNGNRKSHNFTKEMKKKNKNIDFYTVLQLLITEIYNKNIEGFYSPQTKNNLTFVLECIAHKKEYEQYIINDQLVLPLEVVKTEWGFIQNIIDKKDKVYLFKNKYENYFIDFKGNPSSQQRMTILITTDQKASATKLSYIEVLAMQSIFKIFMSDFHSESLITVFKNAKTLFSA